MRIFTSVVAAAAVMAAAGISAAASTVAGNPVEKSAGPVDAALPSRTPGPGALEMQPERRVVPPVASTDRTWGMATDHGHTPTNQELAQGATPAIVELPPVPRMLEYADEGVRAAHHGAGHK
jgi:hypothetical protein